MGRRQGAVTAVPTHTMVDRTKPLPPFSPLASKRWYKILCGAGGERTICLMLPTTPGKCQHCQFSDEPGPWQEAGRGTRLSFFELAREELEAATSELIKLSLALPGAGS